MCTSVVLVCRITGVSQEFRSTTGVQWCMSTAGFHVYSWVHVYGSCTSVQRCRWSTEVHGVLRCTLVQQLCKGTGVLDDYRVEQGYRRSSGLYGSRSSTGEQGSGVVHG
jgi:hypothetical protein